MSKVITILVLLFSIPVIGISGSQTTYPVTNHWRIELTTNKAGKDDLLLGNKTFAKIINTSNGIQVPVCFYTDSKGLMSGNDEAKHPLLLSQPTISCSTPMILENNLICFTYNDELVIMRAFNKDNFESELQFKKILNYSLGCMPHDLSLSPDKKKIAYPDDTIPGMVILDPFTGQKHYVSEGWDEIPIWSPSGKYLAGISRSEGLDLVDTESGKKCRITVPDPAYGALMISDEHWFLDEKTDVELLGFTIRTGNGCGGSQEYFMTLKPSVLIAQGIDLSTIEDLLKTGIMDSQTVDTEMNSRLYQECNQNAKKQLGPELQIDIDIVPLEQTGYTVNGVPYIHQLYDTPDWFDGNWACGPTSCTIAVQKWHKFPYWLTRASWPYAHNSFWGNYIAGEFTHNNITYSYTSYDPSGRPARGAYGYICPDGAAYWGRMDQYMQWAGCTTYYDSSPSWNELKAQIDAGRPCVIATMLTEYGHIVVVIGYNDNHSVIVRDPYGNKNHGYPSYESSAVYDWPGYSNGNENLNSVSLIIGVSSSKTGLTAIIDDGTSNVPRCKFEKFGPSEYWWESDYYGTGNPGGAHSLTNGMLFTYSEQSGDWTNWVQWGFNITKAGYYKFEVFVPRNLATTTSAKYYHYSSSTGQNYIGSVNQNLYYDQWITIASSYYCKTGWNYIRLGDVTGESSPTMIGVDAVRITQN